MANIKNKQTFQNLLKNDPDEAAKILFDAFRELINWTHPHFYMSREQWATVAPKVIELFSSPEAPAYKEMTIGKITAHPEPTGPEYSEDKKDEPAEEGDGDESQTEESGEKVD